ncbi:acid-sensing ion channel 3 [Plakobranchus ocellatus]|uniref:Acid-sensing ion channel 3 n=1 Tax=Plakobranchus ocellatus TaxID=259542 RepID=A0AAV4B5W9_9GAST|nr:acid-sensing ion channel 3 [Plakobranchus ocellatus]
MADRSRRRKMVFWGNSSFGTERSKGPVNQDHSELSYAGQKLLPDYGTLLQPKAEPEQAMLALTHEVSCQTEQKFLEPAPGDENCDASSSLSSDINDIVYSFRSVTTIHGVQHAAAARNRSFRRRLWAVLVTMMAIFLSWFLAQQLTALSEHQISTTTTFDLKESMEFPAVTICNLNQYNKNRVPNDTTHVKHFADKTLGVFYDLLWVMWSPVLRLIWYSPIGFPQYQIRAVIFYMSEYSRIARELDPHIQEPDLTSLQDVTGERLLQVATDAAPTMEEFLLQCRWKGVGYKCSELFHATQTPQGRCYTFDMLLKHHLMTARVGEWAGLEVMLNIQQEDSYYSEELQAGIKVRVGGASAWAWSRWCSPSGCPAKEIKVVVHRSGHNPFPKRYGWHIRPGVFASVALTQHNMGIGPIWVFTCGERATFLRLNVSRLHTDLTDRVDPTLTSKEQGRLRQITLEGTVGGQMGIFLGCSILSIIELIEMGLLISIRCTYEIYSALFKSTQGKIAPLAKRESVVSSLTKKPSDAGITVSRPPQDVKTGLSRSSGKTVDDNP